MSVGDICIVFFTTQPYLGSAFTPVPLQGASFFSQGLTSAENLTVACIHWQLEGSVPVQTAYCGVLDVHYEWRQVCEQVEHHCAMGLETLS